jgi:hypothetical protein
MTLVSVQFINVIFFAGQGRTKVCGEAYFTNAAAGNPLRPAGQWEKGQLWMEPRQKPLRPPLFDRNGAVAMGHCNFSDAASQGDATVMRGLPETMRMLSPDFGLTHRVVLYTQRITKERRKRSQATASALLSGT